MRNKEKRKGVKSDVLFKTLSTWFEEKRELRKEKGRATGPAPGAKRLSLLPTVHCDAKIELCSKMGKHKRLKVMNEQKTSGNRPVVSKFLIVFKLIYTLN